MVKFKIEAHPIGQGWIGRQTLSSGNVPHVRQRALECMFPTLPDTVPSRHIMSELWTDRQRLTL